MNSNDLVLYSYFRSSCSYRVRIALAHKNIPYELRTINLEQGEQHSPEYLKINPLGLVPSLVINGKAYSDSIAIIEYLEEAYPEKSLMPKDLLQRLEVRQICQIITSSIQPLQSPTVAKKYSNDERLQIEWIQFYLNKGFQGLERVLEKTSGKYCVGNEITLADICLVPQVFNAEKRFNTDVSKYPNIAQIYGTLKDVESFKNSSPYTQPGCPKDHSKL